MAKLNIYDTFGAICNLSYRHHWLAYCDYPNYPNINIFKILSSGQLTVDHELKIDTLIDHSIGYRYNVISCRYQTLMITTAQRLESVGVDHHYIAQNA